MISRDEALTLVRKYIKTENTVKHMIAAEAIMKALASKFEPGKEADWGMAGLLHDIDYEVSADNNYAQHGIKSLEILKTEKVDVPESVLKAIQAHSYTLHKEFVPQNKMEWAIFCSDTLTGLIIATCLVRPDKKLATVEVRSVLKKFKDKAFARGTRRDEIRMCEEKLGLPLAEFIDIGIKALQSVNGELGL
jgi:hypothetical protein